MNSNHFLNTKESRSLGKRKSCDYNKKNSQTRKVFSSSGDKVENEKNATETTSRML